MKRFLPSLGVVRSLLIVAVVAAIVGVVGTRLAEGDPPAPINPPPPGSTPPPPGPDVQATAISHIPPKPTRMPPTSVTIRGKELPLPAGMSYGQLSGAGPTLTWDPEPQRPGVSWLSLSDEGRITASHILAEDLPRFQPFIDAALPQLPTTATIAGQDVILPPGMTASQLLPAAGSATKVWCATFTPIPLNLTASAPSLLCVDQDWNTVRNEIHPDEGDAFQPLLEAVTSELPDTLDVNGHRVWPLPGAALQRVIERCEAGKEGTVSCGTYTIRRSGFSFIVFNEDGIIIESVAPEDRADFKPVFDAFNTSP